MHPPTRDPLSGYEYLWKDPSGPYVLVRLRSGNTPYAIFNVESQMALTLDDDALYEEVVERMRRAGVREAESAEYFKPV